MLEEGLEFIEKLIKKCEYAYDFETLYNTCMLQGHLYSVYSPNHKAELQADETQRKRQESAEKNMGQDEINAQIYHKLFNKNKPMYKAARKSFYKARDVALMVNDRKKALDSYLALANLYKETQEYEDSLKC